MTTLARLADIRSELNIEYYERHDAIDALLYAALTRQHAFILGPPGTGKSELTRAFVGRIVGATYFEQLLSKNRPDSAVLGPYDLPLLRDAGDFRRKDKGYLTDCDFAFLDEVGKASPTLGHDLLAALNERIKHQVGDASSVQPIPLHSAFTASNELPAQDSEDEAALWDRLLVRCVVDYIGADANFKALLERGDAPATATRITFEDLKVAVDEVARVVLLDDVMDAVIAIRTALRKDGITIGDRRWRESMKVVRASAWLDGRNVAALSDLRALRFTLWEDLEQRQKIERTILAIAAPHEAELVMMLDEVAALNAQVTAMEGQADDKLSELYGKEVFGKVNAIDKRAERLASKLRKDGVTLDIQQVLDATNALRDRGRAHMGI